MKTFLMMKIYAAFGIAILGIRLAFEVLEFWELVQFLGSAIFISLAATALHKFFEYRSHKTGRNGENSVPFLVQMIVITIMASTGVYFLISYFVTGEFTIGFDIVFYVLFIPAVMLFGIWLYTKISETEYNNKLNLLKNSNSKDID